LDIIDVGTWVIVRVAPVVVREVMSVAPVVERVAPVVVRVVMSVAPVVERVAPVVVRVARQKGWTP
jgi:hypothetical protein